MKKVFSLLITLAMLISTAVVPMSVSADASVWDGTTVDTEWAGTGTEADPYQITSAAELAGLAKNLSDAISTTTTIPVAASLNSDMYFAYSGKYFKLTTDIDLDNKEWLPIGRWGLRFDGIFDGGGHVVKNLKITTEYSALGLFGATGRNARVTNLGVDGINITTTVGQATDYVASGDVTNSQSRVQAIGGLIGSMTTGGTADAPALEGCFTKDVEISATVKNMSHRCMGGLFGTAEYMKPDEDPTNTGNHHYVKNCYVTNVNLSSYANAGAFYGCNYGYLGYDYKTTPKFTNCYVGGTVNIAYNSGTLEDTFGYNFGQVHGATATYTNVYSVTNSYNTKSETYSDKAGIVSALSTVDGWCEDNEKAPINDGYPVLAWENTWNSKWDGTTTDTTWAGTGTETDPYLITSAEELAGLAKVINETDPVAANLAQSSNLNTNQNGSTVQYYMYTDKYFKLTADIDLDGTDWLPIGIVGIKFDGHFDGNNHVVKNLGMTTQRTVAGLFGSIGKNARISNIGVENVDIQTTIGSLTRVNDWDTNRCVAFGGLVGQIEPGGSVEDPMLKGCFAKNVYIEPKVKEMGIQPMGGLVGSVAAWTNASSSNDYHRYYISDCYVKDVELYSHSYIGAFIGGHSTKDYSCPALTNCYVAGDIDLRHTTGKAGYKVWTDSEEITDVDTSTKVSLGTGWPEDYTGTLAVATNNKTTEGKVIHVLYTKETWNSCVYNFGSCLSNKWNNAWLTNCYTTTNAYSNHTTETNGLVTYAPNADVIAQALVTGNNAWNLDSVENPINGGYPVLGWEKYWTVDTDPQAFYKGAGITVADGNVTEVTVIQSDSAVSGTVVVAVYNGTRFESATTATAANGAITLTTPLAVDGGDTVKVFVWNSLDGVSPLGVVYSTTVAE